LQWSWLGYLRLRDAFWPFFMLYNLALFYIDFRVQEGTFTVASWVTIHIILAMPLIYWTGAVWRCSMLCLRRVEAAGARLMIVCSFLDLALRWVMYQYYPHIFFNCQQMIIQWGDF
jgi:glucan phosphoethanolaminetransferase (alkaline phosphatase superfamily)